ncbi:pyridoxal 5'-phosphate synthase glutaminase subunit PdxT [bacterium]|nr:pyridoxal 5'-phosphate synthase glutaminase subunit PdxT [bacterium]
MTDPRVGILALQGAVEKHARHLEAVGASPHSVLLPGDLDRLDAIVLPGGESTTISRLLRTSGLFEPLKAFMEERPVLATCAGMILLAKEVDNLPYETFGLLDISVDRNAWGRQIFSFHENIPWMKDADPLKAVFIRAPRVVRMGDGVELLSSYKGEAVAVRQGNLVALAFHPELTEDSRVHRWWVEGIKP